MRKPPLLSVVIETLNLSRDNAAAWRHSQHALDACLTALEAQTIDADTLEIFVVADTDLYDEIRSFIAERAPYVICLHAPGRNYYEQKNFGAKAATAPFVAFLDSDCVPVPTWAESIHATLGAESNVGAVQGVMHTDATQWGVAFLVTAFGNHIDTAPRKCSSLAASNCSFRRSEFLAEPFVEEPVFHGSDVEMADRINRRGQEIRLHPNAAVQHHTEHGFYRLAGFMIYWGWCFTRLRRQNPDVRYAGLFRALGPLAVPLLVPAKAVRDMAIMWRRGGAIDAPLVSKVGGMMLILAAVPWVGWGAMKQFLGRPAKTPAM